MVVVYTFLIFFMLYSLVMAIEHFKEYLRTKRKRDLIIFVSTILILLIIILIPFDTKRYELYLSIIFLLCGLFLYTLSFMDIESIKERGEDSDTLLDKAEKKIYKLHNNYKYSLPFNGN